MTKKSSDINLLTDLIIGVSDGLIVPFALTAGLSGIISSNTFIAMTGLTATVAGAFAMSVGGYQASRAESHLDHHHHHAEKDTGEEVEETRKFLANIGLSEEMQQRAIEEMKKDKEQWKIFKNQYEEEINVSGHAGRSAFRIGFAYLIGGIVPVSPYFFVSDPSFGLKISAIITLVCLFLFGYFKGWALQLHPWWTALRVMLTGTIAAGAAFGIARLFVQ